MTKKQEAVDQVGKVVFVCHVPEAQAVFVAGTFNDWDPTATPLGRTDAGGWNLEMALPTGTYEFKFIVDGIWCCEPGCRPDAQCPRCVPNPFGTMNRILEVSRETGDTKAGAGVAA